MPTVTVAQRLPYSVIVKFLAECGFRPEQVKGARLIPRCVEVDVLDDGPSRLGHGDNMTFHTMRIPYDPTEQDVPQDARPQDYVIRPDSLHSLHARYAKALREFIEDRRLCESTPRYAAGGWTGPEDEKPEGAAQA